MLIRASATKSHFARRCPFRSQCGSNAKKKRSRLRTAREYAAYKPPVGRAARRRIRAHAQAGRVAARPRQRTRGVWIAVDGLHLGWSSSRRAWITREGTTATAGGRTAGRDVRPSSTQCAEWGGRYLVHGLAAPAPDRIPAIRRAAGPYGRRPGKWLRRPPRRRARRRRRGCSIASEAAVRSDDAAHSTTVGREDVQIVDAVGART